MKNMIFHDAPSKNAPFISERCSRAAIARFLAKAKEKKVDVHAFQVWRDNELMLRASLPPYDCLDKRLYYSLSKSFTATAVGLACDEGLLTTDTRIMDIFPDKLPSVVSDNLAACRVRHVLSMNSGIETPARNACFDSDDLARTYLACDFKYKPGTHFMYDTGATAFLAAIVKKLTGLSALDYLDIKLFSRMGIRDVYWDRTADGHIQGGTGLHASCDDAAKLGLLYLNRGVWNGERLLSEAWVAEASAMHSDNRPSDWPDWESGYGYQFWICSRGGYRGDGAFGQYCFILPDQNVVAAALCEAENLQNAVDIVHELALELFNGEHGCEDVESVMQSFYAMPRTKAPDFPYPEYFKAPENPYGITDLKLDTDGDTFIFSVSDGFSLTSVRCGNGCWVDNRVSLEMLMAPNAPDIRIQTSERTAGISAAYTVADGEIRAELRCRYSPHHVTSCFTKTRAGVKWTLSGLRIPEGMQSLEFTKL